MTRPQWARVRRNGTDAVAHFWSFVQKGEGCWLWTGPVRVTGYGGCYIAKGWPFYPHRIAYELCVGEIPDGLTIDHLCFVKLCVNPAHLEAVTLGENARRMRRNITGSTDTHCSHGHPWSIYLRTGPSGLKSCRECERIRRKRNYDPEKTRIRKQRYLAMRRARRLAEQGAAA